MYFVVNASIGSRKKRVFWMRCVLVVRRSPINISHYKSSILLIIVYRLLVFLERERESEREREYAGPWLIGVHGLLV